MENHIASHEKMFWGETPPQLSENMLLCCPPSANLLGSSDSESQSAAGIAPPSPSWSRCRPSEAWPARSPIPRSGSRSWPVAAPAPLQAEFDPHGTLLRPGVCRTTQPSRVPWAVPPWGRVALKFSLLHALHSRLADELVHADGEELLRVPQELELPSHVLIVLVVWVLFCTLRSLMVKILLQ